MPEIVSVIIPVFKVEPYLDQCVRSVVNQTYTNIEIILVDDGSPDKCGIICDKWAELDNRVRVIHKENGGLSDARNVGLKIASGTYIAFVDSDDALAPSMLETLVSAMRQTEAEIVECEFLCFSDEMPTTGSAWNGEIKTYSSKDALDQLLDENNFKYTVWNKLYTRQIFDSLQFEVGKLHEDVFFTYQAFGRSNKIAKIDGKLYFYRQRSDSIMGEGYSIHSLDTLEARKRQYLYITNNYPELAGKAQNQLLMNCLYLGQKALRCKDLTLKETWRHIHLLFDETYKMRTVQCTMKQKIWYCLAKLNFKCCCIIRNSIKIGL